MNYVCWNCEEMEWYHLCANPCFYDTSSCIKLPPLFSNVHQVVENVKTSAQNLETFVVNSSLSQEHFNQVNNVCDFGHVECDLIVANVD